METASDESLLPELPAFDRSPEDRMHYVQWYFRDFLNGVRGLKPDQIGIYSVILPLIFDSGMDSNRPASVGVSHASNVGDMR